MARRDRNTGRAGEGQSQLGSRRQRYSDIRVYMRQHNLPEPVRYSLKASSGVGFNLDCMLWLEKNYPQDLERIYKTFPMSERVLWEYKNKINQEKEVLS